VLEAGSLLGLPLGPKLEQEPGLELELELKLELDPGLELGSLLGLELEPPLEPGLEMEPLLGPHGDFGHHCIPQCPKKYIINMWTLWRFTSSAYPQSEDCLCTLCHPWGQLGSSSPGFFFFFGSTWAFSLLGRCSTS
jgi:hypothetical protein